MRRSLAFILIICQLLRRGSGQLVLRGIRKCFKVPWPGYRGIIEMHVEPGVKVIDEDSEEEAPRKFNRIDCHLTSEWHNHVHTNPAFGDGGLRLVRNIICLRGLNLSQRWRLDSIVPLERARDDFRHPGFLVQYFVSKATDIMRGDSQNAAIGMVISGSKINSVQLSGGCIIVTHPITSH
ncbi:hypothetical protein FPV67DRAFT_1446918 [Lyophyllum atratum]|nr:hypothetical protein FPV67DRAFT_1446918 [Lyophyllum atratum]